MNADWVAVGPLEVISLLDASGAFPATWEEAFPVASERDWGLARDLDGAAFGSDGRWWLDFRCVAIRRPSGAITLVDTGIGPPLSPATWAPLPGRLRDALGEADIDVGDVDTVVLTHLHEDHCGGVVLGDGSLAFPDAQHVVQTAEVEAVRARPDRTLWSYAVEPLLAGGVLRQVDGRVELPSEGGAGLALVPTPGHTVGHQSVVVTAGDEEVVVTGDVLVHAVQMVNPDVAYRFEADPSLAAETRRAVLERARSRGSLLATAHLHTPFVRVGEAGGSSG